MHCGFLLDVLKLNGGWQHGWIGEGCKELDRRPLSPPPCISERGLRGTAVLWAEGWSESLCDVYACEKWGKKLVLVCCVVVMAYAVRSVAETRMSALLEAPDRVHYPRRYVRRVQRPTDILGSAFVKRTNSISRRVDISYPSGVRRRWLGNVSPLTESERDALV